MKYKLSKTVAFPGGGSLTVTIRSSSPINEQDYLILRPDTARATAETLASIANARYALPTPPKSSCKISVP